MAPVNEDLSQLLGRLAAGIDDVIDAEMSTALEVVGQERPPRPAIWPRSACRS